MNPCNGPETSEVNGVAGQIDKDGACFCVENRVQPGWMYEMGNSGKITLHYATGS